MQRWCKSVVLISKWGSVGSVLLLALGLMGCSGLNYKLSVPFYTPDNSNNIYFRAGVRRPPKYNPYYLNQIADDVKKKQVQKLQEQEDESLEDTGANVAVRDMVDAEGVAFSPLDGKQPSGKRRMASSINNNGDPGDVMPTTLPAKAPPVLPVYGGRDSGIIQLPTSGKTATSAPPSAPPVPTKAASVAPPSAPPVRSPVQDVANDPDLSVLDMGLTETR